MRRARFPSTHMIMPEFRQASRIPASIPYLIKREKNKQEFHRLVELSLRSKIVLHIISTHKTGLLKTTGIVKAVDHHTGSLLIQTLEGPRRIHPHDVQDILA